MYNRAVLARWREDGGMPTIEERVAYLEGRFEDHTRSMDSLHGDITDLRHQMNQRFEQVDQRFEQVDKRFDQIDRRFESIEARFDVRFVGIDGRFVALDAKIDRHFTWLVGIQVAALVAVVGALVGSYYK